MTIFAGIWWVMAFIVLIVMLYTKKDLDVPYWSLLILANIYIVGENLS